MSMQWERYKVVVAQDYNVCLSRVLITATLSGQRCPSTHVGNWKRCTRHLSSCRCPWYHRLPVTRPRLIDSRFFTRTHPLSGISLFLSFAQPHVARMLSPRPRRPCSLYRRFAYTRTLLAPDVASLIWYTNGGDRLKTYLMNRYAQNRSSGIALCSL